MKHILRKIFFWDEPAQGAFFGMTLFFVCSALWFTFYQLLWLSNCGIVQLNIMSERMESEILAWAAGQLLIAAYSLAVFCRAIWLLGKSCHLLHNYRPLLCVLPSIVLCVCCLLFCLVPLAFLLKIISTYGSPFSTLPKWMSLFSNLPPQSWGIAYLFAVLLMTFGGFSIVAAVARGTAVPLRHSLCKPGIALWGVFWVVYCLLLALALMQSAALSPVSSILQKRFGYPLTAEGLREYYQNMGSADTEFWKVFEEKTALPSTLPIEDRTLEHWDGRVPEALPPDVLTAFENYCKTNEAPLREAEKCFDTVPPLPQYDFQPGNLAVGLITYSSIRRFPRLEASRLRIYLEKKDKPSALRAYQRISNCTEHLRRNPFVIGSLVWVAMEKDRLEAVERLLESHLLTEEDLRELASDLTTLEERIPVVHRHAMYTEAVFGLDAFRGMETGKSPEAAIAFAQLRWFYPQLWLQAARDKLYILQQYEREDFTHWDAAPVPLAYIFSSMLLPALKPAGNKFYALTAQVRAMQALLRAESYCREHGDYPQTLPDLPIDPFSGKPMLYRYGTAEITRYVLRIKEVPAWTEEEKTREEYELKPQATQAKVVQVWSVGPNGRNEGGVSSVHINGKDDPCARIRVK
ncbi:MAG: hypothetical protein J6X49_05125 [Victivallales bacterium]|nr:hypothetical protein [Victivallales bacterium]